MMDTFSDGVSKVVQSKEEGKDQESIQSSTTPDTGHCMASDKNTRKHHLQESQEASLPPTGDHKAARNRRDSMAKTNTNDQNYPQKTRL